MIMTNENILSELFITIKLQKNDELEKANNVSIF
jgi:hypothetical protein